MVEQTAEMVVETVAPVMAAGKIDGKKVAITACIILGVAGCAYLGKRAYDKRKAKNKVLEAAVEINPVETTYQEISIPQE